MGFNKIRKGYDMEYDINFDATWKRLKGPKVTMKLNELTRKAAEWVSGPTHDLSGFSKDMQMVPMYLELATYKGKSRFNPAEVTELTGSVKMYKSKIPSSDLIKQLLDIGVEKGEPLSVKEIKDFLSTTALMNKEEQINIIRFIKSLKENISVNSNEICINKNSNKTDLIPYKAYASKLHTEPNGVSQLINLKNLEFVYGITRCKKPEILATIAQKMGPMWGISVVPNDLVQAYEMSNGNMALVQDLLRGFYPWEIDTIVSKLLEKPSSIDLSKYKNRTNSTDYVSIWNSAEGIECARASILKQLGLNDEFGLKSLSHSRKIKTVDGSFEQGKRR
jgi:hypothetical protein